MNRGLIILILFATILPSFVFAQGEEGTKIPANWTEIRLIGQKFFEAAKNILPNAIKKAWNEEALPLWRKMGDWAQKNILDPYIYPFFNKEIKPRGPIIETEFQKEKTEMKNSIKTEVPEETKTIWEKIKSLIK